MVSKALYARLQATTMKYITTGCLTPGGIRAIKFVKTKRRTQVRFALLGRLFPSVEAYGITSQRDTARSQFVTRFSGVVPSIRFVTYQNSGSRTITSASVVMATVDKRTPMLGTQSIQTKVLCVRMKN